MNTHICHACHKGAYFIKEVCVSLWLLRLKLVEVYKLSLSAIPIKINIFFDT